MTVINIRVDLDPEHAPLQFDPADCMDPILEWVRGMGWVLLYVEADGNNGDHYIGGSLDDLEGALTAARNHLANVELA